MVHTLLLRPADADGVNDVFDGYFPDVRPPRCVSRLAVDRPGTLVSIAMPEPMKMPAPITSAGAGQRGAPLDLAVTESASE